jgi:PTS system nitrogen regulatory IIA component
MTEITDLLTPTRVISQLRAVGKEDLFGALATHMSLEAGVDKETVLVALTVAPPPLMLRGGLSLFHTVVDGLDHPVAMVARLRNPLTLGGMEQCPTDLVGLLVSPAKKTTHHLQALSCLARRLRRPDVLSHIRATKCRDVMYLALTSDEWRSLPRDSSPAADGRRRG